MKQILIAITFLLLIPAVQAEQAGETVELGPKPAVDPKIKFLVDQLGAADTVQREDAEKALSAMGKAAIPALKEGELSPNPEIAARAKRINARLADNAVRPGSYADVFPADSILFLEFNDAAATVEKMKNTPLGKLWDKPQTKALIEGWRAGLPNNGMKVFDAINALPKLASGKAVFGLGSADTVEPHEIDPPMIYVLETKTLPAVETQIRIMYEGMNDPARNKRQYKKFQIEEQTSAGTVFGQDRLIHSLTGKGIEAFLDNLITPPAKPLSPLLASLRKDRPNADVHLRLSANGFVALGEANQIIDEDQAKMLDAIGFQQGSFFESALTLNAEGVEELSRLSLSNGKANVGLLGVLQRMAALPPPADPKAAIALDLIPKEAALVAGFSGDVSAHGAELAAALRSFDQLTGEPIHPEPNLNAPPAQAEKPVNPNAPVVPPRQPTRAEEALKEGGGTVGKDPAAMKEAKPKNGGKANKEPERTTPHLERLAKAGLTLETLFSQSSGPIYLALFPERVDITRIAKPTNPNNPPDPDRIPMAALFAMTVKDPAVIELALQKANIGLQPRFVKRGLNGGDFYAEEDDDDNSGGFWLRGNYFAYATSKDILELASAASLNQAGTERIASRADYVAFLANGYDKDAILNIYSGSRQFFEMPYNMARLQWDTNDKAPWPDFSIVAGLLKGNTIRIKLKQVNGVLQFEAQTPISILGMIEALRRPLDEAGLFQ